MTVYYVFAYAYQQYQRPPPGPTPLSGEPLTHHLGSPLTRDSVRECVLYRVNGCELCVCLFFAYAYQQYQRPPPGPTPRVCGGLSSTLGVARCGAVLAVCCVRCGPCRLLWGGGGGIQWG